ncbi:dGTP triphosphohydrolase [Flavihumibacter petaseus]|nr:dNTP triphosphohydrolase [Flavihumibacter petaseus]
MDWNSCFSHGRFGQGIISATPRTPYERDFDRLIFSAAFRRLQDKTQVFPLPGPVLVHNRLTHSLEVASVGRSLGKIVGERLLEVLTPELHPEAQRFYLSDLSSVVAAACLAHDIGNPSFGHSGEAAISAYFQEEAAASIGGQSLQEYFSAAEWSDLTHFEGNANALRILTHHYANRQKGGFQLTYTTLAAIAKYPCESTAMDGKSLLTKKFGFFQKEKEAYREIAGKLQLNVLSESPLVFQRHPFVWLVEAADDICYRIIDWEDAHRLGIIDSGTAIHLLLQLLETSATENMDRVHRTLNELQQDPREQLAYLRAKAINFLTVSCSEVFIERRNDLLTGIYNRSLIDGLNPATAKALSDINEVTVSKIYNHETVVKIELAGYEVMRSLLTAFIPAVLKGQPSHKEKKVLKLLPLQYREEEQSAYDRVLSVIDFIAGMTDSYAMELYKNLRGISLPTHT